MKRGRKRVCEMCSHRTRILPLDVPYGQGYKDLAGSKVYNKKFDHTYTRRDLHIRNVFAKTAPNIIIATNRAKYVVIGCTHCTYCTVEVNY